MRSARSRHRRPVAVRADPLGFVERDYGDHTVTSKRGNPYYTVVFKKPPTARYTIHARSQADAVARARKFRQRGISEEDAKWAWTGRYGRELQ